MYVVCCIGVDFPGGILSDTKHTTSTSDSCTPDSIMTHEQILTELTKINQELMKHTALNGKQNANVSTRATHSLLIMHNLLCVIRSFAFH